jgi:ribosomal protein S5
VAENHENTKIEAKPAKIGGGNVAGAVLSRICTLSNITNTATTMKKE